MTMSTSFIIVHLSIVVLLLMATFTATNKIPQSTSILEEVFQPDNDDEQNQVPVHPTLEDLSSSAKDIAFNDEILSNSDEEDNDDVPRHYYNEAFWPQLMNKRFTGKAIRGGSINVNGGDSRLWAIPYRFGKRAAMPYRFGKRAGMHFRLGKKSGSL